MNKNDINKLFQELSPTDDKKEEIYNNIINKKHKSMKNNMKENTKLYVKNYKKWTRTMTAGVVISFLLVVTATATVLGNFNWFMDKFNPDFKEIVKPVEIYSEDKGIRMEVIGGQKYGNKAVVYLSLQDITGKNRLTERTEFKDGFGVRMKDDTSSSNISWGTKMIYFNKDTNTIYYEFSITADVNTPLADPLELSSFVVYFNEKLYEDQPINLSLKNIKNADTIPIGEKQIWGGSNLPKDLSSSKKVMTIGKYANMPHNEKDQWISNIGIVDGKLHVQIGRIFNKEFGSSDATISLKDKNGNIVDFDYSLVFFNDENNKLISINKDDYSDAINKYEEFIFPINMKELDKYSLHYTGGVYTGVEGNWRVATNLSDSNKDIITWENDIPVEGHLFKYITISPLGTQMMGTYEGYDTKDSEMKVEIETIDGKIQLEYGGGGIDIDKHTFDSNWNTKEPLDITKVKAIVINNIRIPIK